ncbi:metal-dependent hydrolase [Tsuneonella sp. SYSU-LHT278]|uniref:metal-dependent hydrolase n=1 Tax=Tsuneonella sediminis TaxID=3416089 RepID=UPI003F7AA302
MDNLTHSLVGVLIGQAGLKRKTGLAMPALILGANLPDIDAACLFWVDGVEHLAIRRGVTHGPIAWVLLPLVLAAGLWLWDRWQDGRGKRPRGWLPVHFGWLYGLSFLATLTHPALDWLNVYGIRLLEPFSSRWFYGDTLFIIDVWLWALLGTATWFSLRREKRGREWRRPARIAIAVALAYVGLNGVRSQFGPESPLGLIHISSPLPVASLAREDLAGTANDWRYWDSSAQDWVPLIENAKRCSWPEMARLRQSRPALDAFLFWSRAPFAERAPDGSVLIRDARYFDPRARDRFTVALPDVRCEPL